MNPSELRKGNYFNIIDRTQKIHLPIDFTQEIVTIELFKVKFVNVGESPACAQKFHEVNYRDMSPIPLTEKWLLKFGFEKTGTKNEHFDITHYHYENNNFWIYLINEGFEVELKLNNKSDDRFNFFRTYKFVHELQNIHSLVIQKELTL